MSHTNQLTSSFAHSHDGTVTIDQEGLDRFVTQYLGQDAALQDHASYTQLFLNETGKSSNELFARSRGWVVHLGRDIAQSALAGTLIVIAMKALSQTDLSVIVLPAILPLLFQLEKADLSMANEELLIHLYRKVGSEAMQAEEMFQAIPDHIRENVNRLDFLEFLEKISLTGHARETERGVFELRHPDYPRFRVNIEW